MFAALKNFLMNKSYSFLVAILIAASFCNSLQAQSEKEQFIHASVGIGLAAPYDESTVDADGFYAQGEYVYKVLSWFDVRPYAGVIFASGGSDEPELQQYKMKANAFMLGTKVRVLAPIPYVAPFIESGVGLSAGNFQTYTEYTDVKKSGVLLHIPFAFGLALGRHHNFEVKFTYYYHNTAEQFSGAVAAGYSFPLN